MENPNLHNHPDNTVSDHEEYQTSFGNVPVTPMTNGLGRLTLIRSHSEAGSVHDILPSSSSLTSSLTTDSLLVQQPTNSSLNNPHNPNHHHHNHNNNNNNTIPHTNTTAEASMIHDEARVTNWQRVQSLAISHPHHASYKSESGLTALHHACSRRCPTPSVFDALIKAHPHAIIEKDDAKGWTPLHHACRFKCPPECVRLLLQSFPDYGTYAARVRDREKGRTPLYYAIRYDAPKGVVELLLKCMERMDILDCDRDGKSVLELIWDHFVISYEGKRVVKYYTKILEQWKDAQRACNTDKKLDLWWNQVLNDSSRLREGLKHKLKDKWDKVNMILRGAFQFEPIEDDDYTTRYTTTRSERDIGLGNVDGLQFLHSTTPRRKWRILHAAASIKCHHTLLAMACILHPEQGRELDENDLSGTSYLQQQQQHGINQNVNVNMLSALHLAAKASTSGSDSRAALRNLLLLYPESASIPNPADASLPLHYLCENESKPHWVNDGICYVYRVYTEAVTRRDYLGRTPLHRACSTSMYEDEPETFYCMPPPPPPPPTFIHSPTRPTHASLARSISTGGTSIGATPTDAAVAPSNTSNTSSRDTILTVEDPVGSIIQNILSEHPNVASISDNLGKLPLHSIAEFGEDWGLNVQAVYDAYPRALQTREGASDALPLHLVASNLDAKPRLIGKIVEFHPRAASIPDRKSRLPLHFACEAGKSWESGLEEIYNAFPNAIHTSVEGDFGWLPLHFVVASPHSSLATIQKILELSSEEVCERVDLLGRTPFHLAVESGKTWEDGGLRSLFEAYPEAIERPDNEGKIPLVSALLTYCSNDVADTLHTGEAQLQVPSMSTLQPLDEANETHVQIPHSDVTYSSFESGDVEASDFDVLGEQHLAQVNVLYHLLKTAPNVLADTVYQT